MVEVRVAIAVDPPGVFSVVLSARPNHAGYVWSSTDYDRNYAWAVGCEGLAYYRSQDAYHHGVIPVKELSIS